MHDVSSLSFIAEVPANTILEMFGCMFFDFCQESGYESILQVLGSTTRDFLQNLDALHDHLATIYPGMRAPSFCCTERPEDGATILHYYSERAGLEYIVIGLVKTVAKKLHNTVVDVQIYKTRQDGIDHVQFLITESGENVKDQSKEQHTVENVLSLEPKISPDTFARVFPFHLMFDRSLTIVQAGKSISRLIPDITSNTCRINDLFGMVRPHMEFTFDNILSHVNTVYVLVSHPTDNGQEKQQQRQQQPQQAQQQQSQQQQPQQQPPQQPRCQQQPSLDDQYQLRLKGEMAWVPEADCILFLCSPAAVALDDLSRLGMYLSDIPLHDATRDLVLLSEQFHAGYKLTRRLEVLTDQLQQTYRQLEDEKKKTDK